MFLCGAFLAKILFWFLLFIYLLLLFFVKILFLFAFLNKKIKLEDSFRTKKHFFLVFVLILYYS
jgi:hypothetical protein